MKIAFQGTKGSYSEEALYKYFGKENIIPTGLALSEEVCEALDQRDVAAAILPVENSIVGNVDVNMDLIFKYHFYAIGELYLPIKHCLLATKGTKLQDLKKVYSHPIALAQCHDFLKQHGIQAIPEYDTAGAAKLLSESNDKETGTISSSLCSEYYGLDIISNNVQKVQNNITSFLVFIKESQRPIVVGNIKTSIAFCTKHHPGALLGCLQEFSNNSINLTKLESRPIPENPFMYIFYIDFMGSMDDSNTITCLKNLEEHATSIKIIGSYPCGDRPDLM